MDCFFEDLKNEVQCSLCNNTLTEPKILQCLHTFCKNCIKEHVELANDSNVLKCPECEYETFLPAQASLEYLQTSLLHSRILNGLALAEGRIVCSVSESHETASWYCFECDHSLCEECEKNHSFFTNNHNIVPPAYLKKEDIEAIITRERHCRSHPHHRLELFCEDCDEMICVECLKQDHNDHNTMSLDEFASIKKAVLSKHLQKLEQLGLDDKEKHQQEDIAYTIKEQGEKAKEGVKNTTQKLMHMIQQNERDLLRQIDEKMNTATRNLKIIHHIPAVKEYIKNVMERGLASEMIDVQETHCTEKFAFNPIPLSSRVVFLPNQELEHQVYTGLGEIQSYSETDNTMSTIQVEGELEAARQHKLILKTKTSTGMDSINAGDVVDVQISPEEYVRKEETDVRTGGRIEIGFMAKVAGQLTADVQVNGGRLSNSPLVMNVKPQEMRITGQFIMNGVDTESHSLTGIAVNRDNSVIAIADCTAHCVHVFNTGGDLLLTYGCHGRTQEQLCGPEGLAFLNDTDLVIADWGNHRICIVNIATGTLIKTFGNQGNGNGNFCGPVGVHVDDEDGDIIVGDNGNHRVQIFTRDGDYKYQFSYTEQEKFHPVCAVKHNGMFYTSDYNNNNIVRVPEKKGDAPTRITTIGGIGSADGQLNRPLYLSMDNRNNLLVCDRGNNRIQKFTPDGRFVGKTCDEIKNPVSMAALDDDQILLTTSSGVWFVG